ncbi:MAG: CBS domain-containing protein [Kofleriaceae bacterium]
MRPVLVNDIMTSPVVTFFEEQTLPLAEDVMRFKHLRHLPVIDDGRRLVGLVTHRDLLRAQISPLTGLSASERRARQEDVPVRHIMTRDIWTVRATTLASVAGETMLDHGYGCMPVVDAAYRLVGIVTAHDFLRFAIKSLRIHDPQTVRMQLALAA